MATRVQIYGGNWYFTHTVSWYMFMLHALNAKGGRMVGKGCWGGEDRKEGVGMVC